MTAFTLIELIVVISIIALLMSILLPTMQKAREASLRVACASSFRQIGIAVECYHTDNNEWVPEDFASNVQGEGLAPYLGGTSLEITGCPHKGHGAHESPSSWSYAMNAVFKDNPGWPYWGPLMRGEIRDPDNFMMGIEAAVNNTYSPAHWESYTLHEGRHNGLGLNILFGDLHVGWLNGDPDPANAATNEWRTYSGHVLPQSDTSKPCSLGGCFWHPF